VFFVRVLFDTFGVQKLTSSSRTRELTVIKRASFAVMPNST
jgi:hypothetical protein